MQGKCSWKLDLCDLRVGPGTLVDRYVALPAGGLKQVIGYARHFGLHKGPGIGEVGIDLLRKRRGGETAGGDYRGARSGETKHC
jgi:hypothetical protein